MKQLVSVYRRKGAFLLCPSSQEGEGGFWVAHPPGMAVSCEADDAVLGELLDVVRSCSRQNLLPREGGDRVAFPLASVAGVAGWSALARSSPTLVQVHYSPAQILVQENRLDGSGHVPVQAGTILPASASASTVAAAVRKVFAGAG